MTERKNSEKQAARDHRVALIPCPDYSETACQTAVDRVLAGWEGLERVGPGVKVGVKVNLIAARDPDRAATTHPGLVAALCRRLTERGASVTVGDSPGGLFTESALKRVYAKTGMDLAAAAGARLNLDTGTRDLTFPEAAAAHVFTCTSWLLDQDLIIDFTKLKAHGMVRMTAAVKNMFGAVPGTTKAEYHMRFPDQAAFSDMLIDLNERLRPALNLIDGVVCMEGNGPTAGTPRPLGLVLASEDPYALDMVCAGLLGFGRQDVPTLEAAYRRGLGPGSWSEVTTVGERIPDWRLPDFRTAADVSITFTSQGPVGGLLRKLFARGMQQIPKLAAGECVGCGMCGQVCPAHAIRMRDGKPAIDRKACIRCFCCQEFCPEGAMKVHRTALARLLQ